MSNNAHIYEWLDKQGYQTERDDTGEYTLYFELDMPKILKDYVDWVQWGCQPDFSVESSPLVKQSEGYLPHIDK